MSGSSPRGIEHVGITVPDHHVAVRFFEDAFEAQTLFSLVRSSDYPVGADRVGARNGLAWGTAIVAVSMWRLGNGANLEVFEIDRPTGARSAGIADIGISHFSLTVDDVDAAKRFQAAGSALLEGAYDLTGHEAGPGNRGRFGLMPWWLLIEFKSFRSPIRTDGDALFRRWLPAKS